MALGTYDQEERKKKVVYNADGTTNEEKADRSVVSAAPVHGDALAANPALAKTLPVTQTPQAQNVAPVNGTQQNTVSATPPPAKDSGTFQESQSNVNSGGDIKNNQGEVNQDTGTSLESQVGPESSTGAENVQWAGAPQGDVTSTYNNIISPPQATPPLNAPVREFGGFSFSTVTPTGKALTDSDMDAYFGMLKKKSDETGEPIEYLDKLAGNLLVGKTQAESEEQPQIMHTITRAPDAEDGKNTTTNGETSSTAAGAQPGSAANSGASPSVLDYQRLSADTLRAMSSLERDPEKKKTIDAALALKGEGPQATTVPSTSAQTTTTSTSTAPVQKRTKRQQARIDEAAQKMSNKDVYNGNVDLTNRKRISGKEMRAAGYTDFPEEDYATLYSMQKAFKDKSQKGKYIEVLYTPIMADGTVLSQKEVDDYITGLGKKGNIVELDKPENGGKGLVIRTGDKGDLGGGELHELQEQYYSTPEDYAAMGKEAESRIVSLGGNQNPLSQKPVTKKDMVDAGWSIFSQYPDDEIYAHTIQQIIVDSNGKEHKVIMTPITKDGDILSPEQFDAYVSSLQENPDIMGADRSDSSLILKYDAEDGDARSIYDDIFAWRLGQPEKDETQGKALGNTYKDDTERRLAEDIERGQKEIDAQNERIRKFIEDPGSETRGSLARKTRDDKLKEEGLDEESEKRLEKRRKTSNIIANIGDILQGFANLAGAWYGAKSSDLTSLSAASQAGDEKMDVKRKARRDEILKNYEKAISSLGDDMQKELDRLNKIVEKAQDRYMNYISSTGKTELRYQRSEEKAQRDAERRRKEQDRKEQYQRERDEKRAKAQAERDKRNHEYRIQEKQYGAHMSAWAKAQPTYGQLHPQSNGNNKKKPKQSEGSLN